MSWCTARDGGRPLAARNIYRAFQGLFEKAHVPRDRLHALRHTAATLLLATRVNPKVVSALLGHATVAITLDIYAHVIPELQQDLAAAMAKLLHEAATVPTGAGSAPR